MTGINETWRGTKTNFEKRQVFQAVCEDAVPRCDKCFWAEPVLDTDVCRCHRFPGTGTSDIVVRWGWCGEFVPFHWRSACELVDAALARYKESLRKGAV